MSVRRCVRFVSTVFLCLAATHGIRAQTLLAQPNIDVADNATIEAVAQRADGSVVVGGDFAKLDGTPRSRLARYAADGTLDASWTPAVDGRVIELAADGDAVYAGVETPSPGGSPMYRLLKIDATGAIVWSVVTDLPVRTIAANGGDVFVGGAFRAIGDTSRAHVAKLSAQTGAVDATWAPALDQAVSAIVVVQQLVYVGGSFSTVNGASHRHLARFARGGAGAPDTAWNVSPDAPVLALAADTGGTLYIARHFGSTSGTPHLLRASLATGALDPNWNPVFDSPPRALAIGGGSLYVGGGFTTVDGAAHVGNARFALATGALDATWTVASSEVNGIAVVADGSRVVLGGPGRDNALPQPALTMFDAAGATVASPRVTKGGRIGAVARMHDGGVMIGGKFTAIDGHERAHLARLAPDGTLDTTWRADADYEVVRLTANGAGEVFAGGSFTTVAGQPRTGAAKFSAAGALDASWQVALTSSVDVPRVAAFAFGDGGATYIGGEFDSVGGQPRRGVAKLDAQGAIDATWNPGLTGAATTLHDLAYADGQVYLGGWFVSVGGQSIRHLARVAAGGTGALDATWNPAPSSGPVSALALRGGSLYVAGLFTTIGGESRGNLAKLARSGTGAADAGWNAALPPMTSPSALALDGAGQLHVAGSKALGDEGPVVPVALRVSRGGVVDAGWQPAIEGRNAAAVLADRGGVVVAGEFERAAGESRSGIAAFDDDVIFGDGAEP